MAIFETQFGINDFVLVETNGDHLSLGRVTLIRLSEVIMSDNTVNKVTEYYIQRVDRDLDTIEKSVVGWVNEKFVFDPKVLLLMGGRKM